MPFATLSPENVSSTLLCVAVALFEIWMDDWLKTNSTMVFAGMPGPVMVIPTPS